MPKERGFNKSQFFRSGFANTKALKQRDCLSYLIHDPKRFIWAISGSNRLSISDKQENRQPPPAELIEEDRQIIREARQETRPPDYQAVRDSKVPIVF